VHPSKALHVIPWPRLLNFAAAAPVYRRWKRHCTAQRCTIGRPRWHCSSRSTRASPPSPRYALRPDLLWVVFIIALLTRRRVLMLVLLGLTLISNAIQLLLPHIHLGNLALPLFPLEDAQRHEYPNDSIFVFNWIPGLSQARCNWNRGFVYSATRRSGRFEKMNLKSRVNPGLTRWIWNLLGIRYDGNGLNGSNSIGQSQIFDVFIVVPILCTADLGPTNLRHVLTIEVCYP